MILHFRIVNSITTLNHTIQKYLTFKNAVDMPHKCSKSDAATRMHKIFNSNIKMQVITPNASCESCFDMFLYSKKHYEDAFREPVIIIVMIEIFIFVYEGANNGVSEQVLKNRLVCKCIASYAKENILIDIKIRNLSGQNANTILDETYFQKISDKHIVLPRSNCSCGRCASFSFPATTSTRKRIPNSPHVMVCYSLPNVQVSLDRRQSQDTYTFVPICSCFDPSMRSGMQRRYWSYSYSKH